VECVTDSEFMARENWRFDERTRRGRRAIVAVVVLGVVVLLVRIAVGV
jgi:hypothetical protein